MTRHSALDAQIQEPASMTRSSHRSSTADDVRGSRSTLTRRRAFGVFGAMAGAAGLIVRSAFAQDSTPESTPAIEHTGVGELPTTGALRPGPVGQQPPETATNATIPASIIVEAAGIDADIEALNIVDGRMEDPTGPWVVSWYQQSAELGEIGNVMLAGHVDYWGVGPSVFYNVRDLAEGDEIVLTGENGEPFTYAVAWNQTFTMDELISGQMAEIVAPSDNQIVTLFTCGGEFDYVNGEYLSRTVVRGERVIPEPPASTPEA
jgi:sortase (surface protein transpeptidase)